MSGAKVNDHVKFDDSVKLVRDMNHKMTELMGSEARGPDMANSGIPN